MHTDFPVVLGAYTKGNARMFRTVVSFVRRRSLRADRPGLWLGHRSFREARCQHQGDGQECGDGPIGRLAVASPVFFGRTIIAPLISEFLSAHPRVAIDLTLTDRAISLVDEGFDMAIHAGSMENSSLISRKIGSLRRVVCGSPAYLKRRGVPQTPCDLGAHECLLFTFLDAHHEWLFLTGKGEQSIRISSRFQSNNADTILIAAVNGAGLILAPWVQVFDRVAAGELEIVLEKFELPLTPLHVLFPHAKLLSAKVRAFTALLAEEVTRRERVISSTKGGRRTA